MAEGEEVRHAGIGIDLHLSGLEGLKYANETINQLRDTMKEGTTIAEHFGNSLNGIGDHSGSKIGSLRKQMLELRDDMDSVKDHNKTIEKSFLDVKSKITDVFKAVKSKKSDLDVSSEIEKNSKAIKDSNDSVNKGSGFFSVFGKTIDKASERSKRFHDILFGSFVGNAVSNGIQTISSDLWEAAKHGAELVEGGAKIQTQWKNIGLNQSGAEAMTKQIAEIRGESNMAGGQIDAIQKKFYALTNSAPKARQFTNEIAAFGSAAGKSGQEIQTISNGIGRLMGSKTVSAGFFQRSIGQMPALQKAIVKASGMSNKAFQSQLKNSKITGEQLQEYMSKAAKKSSLEWSVFAKTTQGKIAGIKGTWQNMTATFTKPVVGGVTEALDKLGKGKGGLSKVKNDLKDISTSLGTKVGNFAGEAIKFIVSQRKPLGEIIGSITKIGSTVLVGAWKAISGSLSLMAGQSGKASKGIKGAANGLQGIAKQKTPIQMVGKALVGMFVVSKILGFSRSLSTARQSILKFSGSKTLLSLATLKGSINSVKGSMVSFGKSILNVGKFMLTNPWGIALTAILAVGTTIALLYKHNKKFRKFVNGLASAAAKAFGNITKFAGKMVNGVVGYFNRVCKSVSKRWGNLWNDSIHVLKDAWKSFRNLIGLIYDLVTGKWTKLGRDVKKLTKSMWSYVKDIFKESFDWLNDLTGGRLSKMIKAFQNAWDSIGKAWHSFWGGIKDWFGDLWKGIVKGVQDGINSVIKVLNAGIGGIDSVIHAFGGKNTTVGKIGYVHFAKGTGYFGNERRPITQPTLARLNDGQDSPETHNQEVVMHANGALEAIKGANVTRLLEPGAEVFNASESRELGLTAFKKGTGFFSSLFKGAEKVASNVAGGVENGISGIGSFTSKAWHGATHLLGTIQKLLKSPGKYLSSMMGSAPKENGAIMSQLSGGMFDTVKGTASGWWSGLMGAIKNVLHSDSGADMTGLVSAMQKFGHGHRYVWGATGPDTFDCSGLVMYALKHAFGIDYPHFSGSQYSKSEHISKADAKPGDLVFFGPGGDTHVGVYAGHGDYYSALNPNRHPNIGMSPVSTGPGHPLYARVRGLAAKTKGSNKKEKHSGSYNQYNNQTGGMLSWIKKHLAPLLDSGGYGSMGNLHLAGGMGSRAREIAKALKSAYPAAKNGGIAGILGNWIQESGLSPSAIDAADHGSGLGQWTNTPVGSSRGRESNMRTYLKRHGYAWNSAKGQLEFALHEGSGLADQFKSVLRMSDPANAARRFFAGWESGGNEDATGSRRINNAEAAFRAIKKFAKGGKVAKNQLSIVGEKGWELFAPKSEGTVIPHEASKDILNGSVGKKMGAKSIKVEAPVNVTIKGNADDKSIDYLGKILNKRNDDLVDKLAEQFGFNNDGGLII